MKRSAFSKRQHAPRPWEERGCESATIGSSPNNCSPPLDSMLPMREPDDSSVSYVQSSSESCNLLQPEVMSNLGCLLDWDIPPEAQADQGLMDENLLQSDAISNLSCLLDSDVHLERRRTKVSCTMICLELGLLVIKTT